MQSILKVFNAFMVILILLFSLFTESVGQENTLPAKEFINSLEMKFVFIQPGRFLMGSGLSPEEVADHFGGNAKWYSDEGPQHPVTLTRPYYIQITEVTQWQWSYVMGNNPSMFTSCGGSCPVEKVSWNDAQEFIKKLNLIEKTDKYRLPTEAEWEYACRAGSTTAFCFGNKNKALQVYAWHSNNSRDWPHQVNHKMPNAWGIYDMHGNVWEWCADWYGDYPSNAVIDPTGPKQGTHRVSRGGSWRSAQRFCRSAHRFGVDPDYRRPNRGFRIVKNP